MVRKLHYIALLVWKGARDFGAQVAVSLITTVGMSLLGTQVLTDFLRAPTEQRRPAAIAQAAPPARLTSFAIPLFFSAQTPPYQADFSAPAALRFIDESATAKAPCLRCQSSAPVGERTAHAQIQADPPPNVDVATEKTTTTGSRWIAIQQIHRSANAFGARLAEIAALVL